MSAHRPRTSWQQPTAQLDTLPAKRRLPPTGILVVSILAVVVAVVALGFLVFGPPGGPSESDAAAKPLMVVPSTSTESTLPVTIFTTDPGARGTDPSPTRAAVPTTKASHSPKTPKTPKPTETRSKPVRAGARCAPVGALGRNNKGLPMICALSPDGRARWRRL